MGEGEAAGGMANPRPLVRGQREAAEPGNSPLPAAVGAGAAAIAA